MQVPLNFYEENGVFVRLRRAQSFAETETSRWKKGKKIYIILWHDGRHFISPKKFFRQGGGICDLILSVGLSLSLDQCWPKNKSKT